MPSLQKMAKSGGAWYVDTLDLMRSGNACPLR